MKAIVAKKLRKQAEKSSQGKLNGNLVMQFVRKIKTGKVDDKGKPMTVNVAGTYRHAEGTTRRIYKDLKLNRRV